MNFYGAAIREVLPGPEGHAVVRYWPPSAQPRVYVLNAFAHAVDDVAARMFGPTACAAVYRPHPESLHNAIDIVIPDHSGDAKECAEACCKEAIRICGDVMLQYQYALTRNSTPFTLS